MKKSDRKKRRIVSVILMGVLCALIFVSCSKPVEEPTTKASTEASTEPTKSRQELHELYLQAVECEKTAKFKSAIEIYRELYSYGYSDEGYSGKSLDEALALREQNYACQKLLCYIHEGGVRVIKKQLKDPNSLEIYGSKLSTSEKYGYIMEYDYGARNSFGGMVRDTYTTTPGIFDSDIDKIYSVGQKAGMQSKDEVYTWLQINNGMIQEKAFKSIIEGTCDY